MAGTQAIADAALGRLIDAGLYLSTPRLPRRYWLVRRELPAIAFPRGYCERVQWRKLFDHNPLFVTFSDKLATKEHIARRRPGLALPRVLWTGIDIDDAPDSVLAGDVVVKGSHGSNMNHFIAGGHFDRAELRRITRGWMAQVYGAANGEWAYRHVPRRLLVEERLPGGPQGLLEINIRAGRGRVIFGNLLLHAKTPRQSVIYVNARGERTGAAAGAGVDLATLEDVPVPAAGFRDAMAHAAALAEEVDFARCDFFWSEGRLMGGEITVYPQSGYAPRNPHEQDVLAMWDLRESWFMRAALRGWKAIYRRALLRHLDRTGQ